MQESDIYASEKKKNPSSMMDGSFEREAHRNL
jgi:hypothetical protein